MKILILGFAFSAWGVFADVAADVRNRLRNDPFMMPFYTGRIYPEPRKADYSSKFVSLRKTGLILGGKIKKSDPRIGILKKRISQYGGKAELANSLEDDFETFIVLGDALLSSDLNVPARNQGYAIKFNSQHGKNIILLKGYDNLGLTWAVSSFIQLVDYDDKRQTSVRAVNVIDYPVYKNRGFVNGAMRGEYAPKVSGWPRAGFASPLINPVVYFKMSKVTFSGSVLADRRNPKFSWKKDLPEESIKDIQKVGAILTPLGIEWYVSLHNLSWSTEEMQIRSKNEDDFKAVFKKACVVMDAGGHICIMYDDLRFPISADDKRDFGTAREADMFFLNKLYKALSKRYDKPVKMLFCPPFYWGPGAKTTYPENREAYLKAIGERLPKGIDIYWTGDRVKTGKKKKSSMEWFTSLIKRKPVFFQNTKGTSHAYWLHYFTDPLYSWRQWPYEGFYNDLDTYQLNVGMPGDLAATLTLMDYLWNPKKYNPETSIKQAGIKLCGEKTYPIMDAINKKLSFFDQFGKRVSPFAAKNFKKMKVTMSEIDSLWKKAHKYHPAAVDCWSDMAWCIRLQKLLIEKLSKNSNLDRFVKNAEVSLNHARKEVGFNKKTDVFLSAYDFIGGHPAGFYSNGCEKRLAAWVYGAKTDKSKMSASFTVEPWPASADYKLIISAQDDEIDKKCRIRIDVDGTAIFEGPNPFKNRGWNRREFIIPGSAMKRNARITISNIEGSSNFASAPWFMLNYAVLRKTGK